MRVAGYSPNTYSKPSNLTKSKGWKQLMDEYPYMKCGNLEEFKQRLQWLSEGMLKNHLTNDRNYEINQEEIALYQAYRKKREQIQQGSQGVAEGWSEKYKRSINCSHPKGFSQRAHCAGKKKHNESTEMEMTCPE